MVQAKKTAAYRVIAGPGGKRVFRFYCDISGELCCVTKSIRADTEDEALEIAWDTEGRWAFDRCPQCGRYVSSAMFNINVERCLDCAPWENEYPVFCHHCGIRLKDPDALLLPRLRGAAAGGRHRGRGGKDRMTEYDLETKKALRRVSLLEYGFGPETLRGRKICPACGRGNGAYRTDCISCGAALPKETLYDFYRARHRCCPGCGVVVTDVAVYCPECGTRLSKETGAKGVSG